MFRKIIVLFLILSIGAFASDKFNNLKDIPLKPLTKEEKRVIIDKGTEWPFTGKYYKHKEKGIYKCKQCGAHLYNSSDKFESNCGWPSFDDEIKGAVKRSVDADGRRTEITCARCGAHLGHVFLGEGYTAKNTRHCVNSISLDFEPDAVQGSYKKAYFAGGCFWGVEYYLEKQDGVKEVLSGYMGGGLKNPSYRDVSRGNTGHLEVVEVTYDPNKVTYESLAKLFFEIHNPEQTNGQGPDIGSQYLSAIFVSDANERKTVKKLIEILRSKGMKPATKILDKKEFYKAEDYHQDYYERHNKKPYCHAYRKIF
jgi:peptide methionine sulfoxide reductase msrA/msrB